MRVVEILIAVCLVIVILLQQQGIGLGSAWGGTGASFRTKQGIEKFLFRTTVALIVLFVTVSLLGVAR